jgi:hypothetical protein
MAPAAAWINHAGYTGSVRVDLSQAPSQIGNALEGGTRRPESPRPFDLHRRPRTDETQIC